MRRTPLYDAHVALGAKMVAFAGWEMPIQYSGIVAEHRAVRAKAGLFDVSHMGEILFHGASAMETLQYLTCNDVSKLKDGQCQYNAILNENGGVVDDILVSRFSPTKYLLCVNASNEAKDFQWLCGHVPSALKDRVSIENLSSQYGQLAIQGPLSIAIASDVLGQDLGTLKRFSFIEYKHRNASLIVSRTGYTGEDGVEVFVPWGDTLGLWNEILAVGSSRGLVPVGLGARDTLRLEAALPLHGHELGDDISALESGLRRFIKFDKGEFLGRTALMREEASGPKRQLCGFVIEDSGIARNGDKVLSSAGELGVVTSGTKTPSSDKALGMALVSSGYLASHKEFLIEVRGKRLKAVVCPTPFYKKTS